MSAFLLVALLFADDTDTKPRKPSAIAPSLPAVTREEEAKFDEIIDRFILADTGRLRGADGKKAIAEFEALKPEAIPALIRGLNRSAKNNYTCPVLMITKKLSKMLMASNDQVLLEFARDEIGADIGRSRYAEALKDLRFKILLRKNALARAQPDTKPVAKGVTQMSTSELSKAASTERGAKLEGIVRELAKRDGKEALSGLTVVANSYEKEMQKLGRASLDLVLGRMPADSLTPYLEDESPEVRRSAVRVVSSKHARLLDKVIDRIDDENPGVRAEARAALKSAGKGKDFGPSANASVKEQREAKEKWREWWDALKR